MNYRIIELKDPLDEITKKIWEKFVTSHCEGNVFQTPDFYEIFKQSFNHYPYCLLAFDKSGNVVGVLLADVQKEKYKLLKRFTSRAIIHGGPIILNNDTQLLKGMLDLYNKDKPAKIIYTQVRNYTDKSHLINIFESAGFKYEDHLNILIDLTNDLANLKLNLNNEKRHNINRAIKKGVVFREIISTKELKIGHDLILKTYKRVKIPAPDIHFLNIARQIMLDKCKYFGAYYDEKLIGIRIVLIFKNTVYDWYAGSDPAFNNKYPNDFLVWKILELYKTLDYRIFDFGGAGHPKIPYGVREFKIKFGGKLVNYGRFTNTHKLIFYKIGIVGLNLLRIKKNGLRFYKK